MSVFVTYFCISGAVIHKVGIGLDQKLSMPDVRAVLGVFFLFIHSHIFDLISVNFSYNIFLGVTI